MTYKISKPDEEWKKVLTPEQFDICRNKGTEQAFTGIYCDTKDDGTYNFHQIQNLIQVQDGQVFLNQLMKRV